MESIEEDLPFQDEYTGLKCSTCGGVELSSLEHQREHCRSDWHVYNAKRRVSSPTLSTFPKTHTYSAIFQMVGLAPISQTTWTARLAQLRDAQSMSGASAAGHKGTDHLKKRAVRANSALNYVK